MAAAASLDAATDANLSARSIPAGERVYAIGDVHGRLDLLEQLVAAIRADNAARPPARVRIILIGDIIDRGPHSAAIVDRCMALTARTGSFIVLKGNHEAMMVDAVRGDFVALALWLRHGGAAALQSWGVPDEIIAGGATPALIRAARDRLTSGLLAWLDDRPLMHRIGDYLFVHAGIRPGRELAEQTADDLLWIRRDFLESEADQGFTVVHGHSISEDGVTIRANRIGIDTGAYRTGILSALAIEGDRRWILAADGEAPSAGSKSLWQEDLAAIFGLETAATGPHSRRTRWTAVACVAGIAALAGGIMFLTAPRASPDSPAGLRSTATAVAGPAAVLPRLPARTTSPAPVTQAPEPVTPKSDKPVHAAARSRPAAIARHPRVTRPESAVRSAISARTVPANGTVAISDDSAPAVPPPTAGAAYQAPSAVTQTATPVSNRSTATRRRAREAAIGMDAILQLRRQ